MTLKCALCNTEEFKNEKQFQEHLEGKKHKKLESIKQSRLESSERSIFVSNLPKNTFTKHLQDYFGQFGVVKKTILDLEKNAYAILEFEKKESVDKVLQHAEPHQINQKTVKVKSREVKEFVLKSGPSTAEKKKEILDKLKDEALTINTLLGKCQTFDEQVDKLIEHLKITDEQLKQREQVCQQLAEIFKKFFPETEFQVRAFGSTATGLACKGSDMDLTLLLNSYLSMNREGQQILPKVVARSRDQLKKQDSKDSSHDGGATNSSGSNMADPDHLEENVDLEMDELEFTENESESSEQALARKILKENIAEFFSEKAYDKLISYSVENQVKIVAQVVQRFLVDIKTLRTITNTRCPLVTFLHNMANTNCDLSMNNFLAVENSCLIKLYMDLEPNLRKLIFVIRYWMTQKNLHSSSRFNSYTIIWLIIFYLQMKQIGNLPTVEQLCQLAGKPNMIHGWNVAFEGDLNKIKSLKPASASTTATHSFNDLLKGFFEFYSQYQFFMNDAPCYISTRQAKLVHDGVEQCPLAKKHAFINIQDPFDLSHNISANISKNTLARFVSECKASNELLSYSVPLKKSETKCWGLILLMTRKALPLTLPGSSVTKMALNSPASLSTDKNLIQQPGADENAKAKKAVDFVMHLFKNCLMFEQIHDEQLLNKKRMKRLKALSQICDKVDTMELNSSPKRIRTSETTSSPSHIYDNNNNKNGEDSDEEKPAESRPIAVYQMVVNKTTWQGRRSIKRILKKPDAPKDLEFERHVSEQLAAKQTQEPKSIHFAVTFSLNKTKAASGQQEVADFSYLKIKFDLLDDYEHQEDLLNFTTFVHFLDIFISNCQEKYFDQWSQTQVVC